MAKCAVNQQPMSKDAAFLSLFSIGLQWFGLLLNVFLTKRLGAASVGVLTLMNSFYGLACVLTGGSGFIATSRFVSEEIGADGNPRKVFGYALRFCLVLSCSACIVICIFTPQLMGLLPDLGSNVLAVRLLSLSLPISAFYACCKGRCYGYQRVYLPAIAECIEFLIRALILAFCTAFLIPGGKISLLTAFAFAMLGGQGTAAIFLCIPKMPVPSEETTCRIRFSQFIRLILPITFNACLVSLLSSANDALVPLTLLQSGSSTEAALAQFGEFEAIILPALFFPSVVQCCLSGLLVPTLSRARTAKDTSCIQSITQRVLEQTTAFSLFVVLIFALFGHTIGSFLGGDAFAGNILRFMAPVVPFIYLEIVLEGILRGLGKQNFSSVNYLAEYMVRISVLLICVPLFGFFGIVASYLACNLTGNAVRLFFVLRATGLRPNWKRILLRPTFALLLSWQCSALLLFLLRASKLSPPFYFVLFCLICGGLNVFLLRVMEQMSPIRSSKAVI
ncbi:MAG: polysaccharide biosynthesis C-terminal domain-containing protein [Oscillospiraceae bacterium]|nr:polysaccharide biosynthesis C-terminal domain-containing protein [Oscillospiraceae bacterium]